MPSLGRVGVAFSSGFFGFFAHAGFLAGLRDLGIVPVAYAGASSGAIVAAMGAMGLKNREIRNILFHLKKSDFWHPDPPWVVLRSVLALFKGYTGYLKGDGFATLLKQLPARRFEDCQYPLAVSAVDVTARKEKIFTKGDLVSAIQSSGSVPMLFKPAKIDGSLYVDGGISGKVPLEALAELCRLDTIIIHLIPSGNVRNTGNDFLKKRFTPWRIQHMAINIARMADYERQKKLVSLMGIKIIEIETHAPSAGPNHLHNGPLAYRSARDVARKRLRRQTSVTE